MQVQGHTDDVYTMCMQVQGHANDVYAMCMQMQGHTNDVYAMYMQMQGHTNDVYACAWHPKKPYKFATACDSSNVFLWNARRRQLIVSGGRQTAIMDAFFCSSSFCFCCSLLQRPDLRRSQAKASFSTQLQHSVCCLGMRLQSMGAATNANNGHDAATNGCCK